MRHFHLAIIVVAFAWTNLADAKTTRFNQSLKKATAHLKPTKGPKNLLDTFKTLPADDFEFIKQLDKQFHKFGDNVKIKVQKINQTTKNTKRTVDESIGYGYQHPNDQQSMYTFLKPKYEYYPYSQHDIPPAPQYQHHSNHYFRHFPTALVEGDSNYYGKQASNVHTSVEVQPSHSYEIKQTEHGYKTIFHGGGGGGGGGDSHLSGYSQSDHGTPSADPVPVIVLRVPGPAKYASHLQALLQQYLEARAAQYIQELQEQEAHGMDNSQQIEHDQEQPDLSAFGALPVLPYGAHHAYLPAQMYIQPMAQIQPYFSQHALINPYANAHIAQPISVEEDHVAATPSPVNYYSAHSQSEANDDNHDNTGTVHPTAYQYHNVHDEHQQYSSDQNTNDETGYGQHESVSQHNQILTNENYPDDKHTRVIFKTSTEQTYGSDSHDQEQEHEQQPQSYLPQSQVSTYRAPLVYHKFEQYYNPHDDQTDSSVGYDENSQSIGSSTPYGSTVAITQRPAVLPQNYHAQFAGQFGNHLAQYNNAHDYDYSSSTEASDEHLYKRNTNKKRQSIRNRDDQYKKFTNLANRMKARMNSEQV